MTRERSGLSAAVDAMGRTLANPWFFLAMVLLHAAWILLNSLTLSGIPRWDPYPFTLLATLSSIEGPLIALMVLMRQHRDSRIEELREELDLLLVLRQSGQITTALQWVDALCQKLEVERQGAREQLEEIRRSPSATELLEQLREQLRQADGTED